MHTAIDEKKITVISAIDNPLHSTLETTPYCSVALIVIAALQERRLIGLNHTCQTGSSMSSSANIALVVDHILQVCHKDWSRTHSFCIWLQLVTSS